MEKYILNNFFSFVLSKPSINRITIFSRYSYIPYFFLRKGIRIHSGNRLKALRIHEWNVGFKFGEFCKTRKRIKFQSKSSKKKSNKKLKKVDKFKQVRNEAFYEKIRLKKSGQIRTKLDIKRTGKLKNFISAYKSIIG